MCPMPMKPRPGFKWSSSIYIAIPFFHQKCSVMILLAIHLKICYHKRVKSKGESGVSSHSPDPPQPAWTRVERHTVPRTASKSYQYIGRTRGSQPPSDAMSLPITSHPSPGADGSPRKECAYEAVLLR